MFNKLLTFQEQFSFSLIFPENKKLLSWNSIKQDA